jgi:hypothetical protein
MEPYKPLRAIIFSYDLLRLLFLAVAFGFLLPLQTDEDRAFPYLVYMSSNALFPMISFFIFLSIAEYRNYLPLYAAGKIIAVVLFYIWAFFSLPLAQGFIGRENYVEWMILLGGVFFISLLDGLSIFGVWVLNKKIPRNEIPEQ